MRKVLIGFLVLVLAFMAWAAVGMFGNPWVRLTMKGRVAAYMAQRYPGVTFTHQRTTFDMFNQRWVVLVEAPGQPAAVIRVAFDRERLRGEDDYAEILLAGEALAKFTPVVHRALPGAVVRASAYRSTPRDQTGPADAVFVSVSWDSASPDVDPFVRQVMNVLEAIRQSGLQADEYHFWCTVGESRNLSVTVPGGKEGLGKEALLGLVAKPGKW